MIVQIATALAIGIYVVLSKDPQHSKTVVGASTAARLLAVRLRRFGKHRALQAFDPFKNHNSARQ